MVKKEVTYVNFDNETVTETLRFNLSRAELLRWEAETHDGLETRLKKMLDKIEKVKAEKADDPVLRKEMFEFFETLIRIGYGEVVDGRFIKDEMRTKQFMASEAYSELLFGLLGSDEGEAAAFVSAMIPSANGEKK